jgi:uncharacterized flavoprotein (TIGR03862 family)
LATGGASWPRLGSDGSWAEILDGAGVAVTPLTAANSGVLIAWSPFIRSQCAGAPLKRISIKCGDASARGEAIITKTGLEGGAVYQLVPIIRNALKTPDSVRLFIDLKPDMSEAEIASRLARPRNGASLSNHLRKTLALDRAAIALVNEDQRPQTPDRLAARIKAIELSVAGLAPLERAISTAGGVAWSGVDSGCMLNSRRGVFVAGEMLDWEAPTGGYLLQATFATAHKAACGILAWLNPTGPGTS